MKGKVVLLALLSAAPALAHGRDPQPRTTPELAANLVVFLVTVGIAAALGACILRPVLADPARRQELFGWGAVAAALVLGVAWWLTRQSVAEVLVRETPGSEHAHFRGSGGQVAMWGDYHAELARIESGEFRLFVSDAYRRPISTFHYRATIAPRNPGTGALAELPRDMEESVGRSYRFALLERDVKSVQVHVAVPGRKVRLNFTFDETSGKRSLPIWCGSAR